MLKSARSAASVAVSVPVLLAAGFSAVTLAPAHAATPTVRLVGTFSNVSGTYASIQAAVDASAPGDWILVAPGDWHEQGHPADLTHIAGVLITTPDLHLRGMDRNAVTVDGTKVGAPGACDAAPSSQNLCPKDAYGHTMGRNGIEIFKADGVTVDNLTVCNFIGGSYGGNGNEIWWNGGDGSGHIGLHGLGGQFLTASSSYNYATDPANHGSSSVPMAQYGIFTSNTGAPGGVIADTYSSNMGDSSYYVGACPDCSVSLVRPHAENSALGFSGTNAGGHLLIANGEWDLNKAGIAPNALNNDDWPSPPDGACPAGVPSPTHNGSCSLITGNNVHDNNNQNAPSYGIAGAAPPGTGILLSGVRNYTVRGNSIHDNDAWGLAINDFPDTETPPASAVAAHAACHGGINLSTPLTPLCDYPAFGNEVDHNTFAHNGTLGNPGNGDIAVAAAPHNPGNCFHNNVDTAGALRSDPILIQTVMGTCGLPNGYLGPSTVGLVCAAQGAVSVGSFTPNCPRTKVTNYPPATAVTYIPINHTQATMPNPCAGVPANAWCVNGSPLLATHAAGAALVPASTGFSLPDTAAGAAGAGTAGLLGVAGVLLGLGRMRRRG